MSTKPSITPLPAAAGSRAEGAASPVASPCVNVCRMDPRFGWCEGCFRTLDEIACWSGYTDEDKRAVIARLAARRAK